MKNPPVTRKIRDYIFSTFAFPLGFNVSFSFWGLYSIDRELVFPKIVDSFYPWWLNHILHTNVLLFILIELFILSHQYSCKKNQLGALTIFALLYIFWVHIVKLVANAWVYPIFYVISVPERIGFFALAATFPLLCYFVGYFINNLVWKSTLVKKQI